MTDLTEKTTALDEQSAVEKKSLFKAYGKTTLPSCNYWGFVLCWLFRVLQQMH